MTAHSAPRFMPTWVAFVVVVAVFVVASWVVLRPTTETCEFSQTICSIESLDDLSPETTLLDLLD